MKRKGEVIIMTANLLDINAIPSASIIMVSYLTVTADQEGNPKTMVLYIAIDRQKSDSAACEFPLYIPATGNYKTVPHIELINLFRKGAPFVPVKVTDLKIYYKESGNKKEYYGCGQKFEVVQYSEVEEIL